MLFWDRHLDDQNMGLSFFSTDMLCNACITQRTNNWLTHVFLFVFLTIAESYIAVPKKHRNKQSH